MLSFANVNMKLYLLFLEVRFQNFSIVIFTSPYLLKTLHIFIELSIVIFNVKTQISFFFFRLLWRFLHFWWCFIFGRVRITFFKIFVRKGLIKLIDELMACFAWFFLQVGEKVVFFVDVFGVSFEFLGDR